MSDTVLDQEFQGPVKDTFAPVTADSPVEDRVRASEKKNLMPGEKVLNSKDYSSFKGFDPNRRYSIVRSQKRQRVMEQNVAASRLIQAAKSIHKKEDQENILNMHQQFKDDFEAGIVDPLALKKVYESKVKNTRMKVEQLENLKIRNNGFLKSGQQKQLDYFIEELQKLQDEIDLKMKEMKAHVTT